MHRSASRVGSTKTPTPAVASARAAQPYPAADIVVQGAVDTELQPLLQALEGKEPIQIGAWTFWRGRIGGRTVIVLRTEKPRFYRRSKACVQTHAAGMFENAIN